MTIFSQASTNPLDIKLQRKNRIPMIQKRTDLMLILKVWNEVDSCRLDFGHPDIFSLERCRGRVAMGDYEGLGF